MNTSSRFAVVIHALALMAGAGGEPLTSEIIADSVSTNPVVIRRALADLRRVGLVESHSGSGGGWCLGKPAGEITLRDVYLALGDGLPFGQPRQGTNPKCRIGCGIQKAVKAFFYQAEEAMMARLAEATIADVLSKVQTTE